MYVRGLQTTQLEMIPAIADVLVSMVTAKMRTVCSGIVGDIPISTPMAVPIANERGLPFSLVNLR